MQLSISQHLCGTLAQLQGRPSPLELGRLAQQLASGLSQIPNSTLIFDLSGLEQLNMALLAQLLNFAKQRQAKGIKVLLCGAQAQPKRLLSMLRVNQVLPIFEQLPQRSFSAQQLDAAKAA